MLSTVVIIEAISGDMELVLSHTITKSISVRRWSLRGEVLRTMAALTVSLSSSFGGDGVGVAVGSASRTALDSRQKMYWSLESNSAPRSSTKRGADMKGKRTVFKMSA